jgi:hypothetical protein
MYDKEWLLHSIAGGGSSQTLVLSQPNDPKHNHHLLRNDNKADIAVLLVVVVRHKHCSLAPQAQPPLSG